MAAVTHRVATASTANTQTYVSGSFTPAVGDLLIVCAYITGNLAPTITDSQGGTYFAERQRVVGSARVSCFIANQLVSSAVATTVTIDLGAGNTGTGTVIMVESVSGMRRTGFDAVRQVSDGATGAGVAPSVVLGANALTGSPTIAFVGGATNPPNVTAPTGWTEQSDIGFATPAGGAEIATRDSGFTGTTVTWGTTFAGSHAEIVVELDTSIPLSPGGVASAEATGTTKLNRTAGPIGAVASGFAAGTAKLNESVGPAGAIASAQAIGSATILPRAFVSPSGVASAQAIGAARLNLQLLMAGLASAGALGAPVLTTRAFVLPPSVTSAETPGGPTVRTLTTLVASGIGSAQVVSTPLLRTLTAISLSGVASAESVPSPALAQGGRITPAGLGSAEQFGAVLVHTVVRVSPAAIASAAAAGQPRIALPLALAGIASAQQLGAPVLLTVNRLGVVTITTAEVFGTPSVAVVTIIRPSGIVSAAAIGGLELVSVGFQGSAGVADAPVAGATLQDVGVGSAQVANELL